MPKESCIDHERRGNFIALRRHIVETFGGDHCAAVVMAYFEYATNGEMDRLARSEETGEPWVSATMASIYEETTGLYSIRSLQERISWLESLGFLSCEQASTGKTKNYLLNADAVNDAIRKGHRFSYNPIGKIADEASIGKTIGKTIGKIADEGGGVKDNRKKNLEERIKPPVVPLPAAAPLPSATLDLDDDVLLFVHNAYSRENRRAKLDNLRTRSAEAMCDQIRRAESSNGTAEFRGALVAYLNDSSDWLREHRWPLRTFLAQISRYVPAYERSATACASPAAPPAPSLPATAPTAPQAGEGQLPYAAGEWNRVVPSGPPVDAWTRRDRDLDLAVADPDFLTALPAVLAACEQTYVNNDPGEVAWLNFRWLVRKGKTGTENWYRIASGEMNWIRSRRGATPAPRKSASASVAENYLAKLEARIKAKQEPTA